MKHTVHRFVNRALSITLFACILATGAYAVSLTHVHASITFTFGDTLPTQVAMADAIDVSTLTPLPIKEVTHVHTRNAQR